MLNDRTARANVLVVDDNEDLQWALRERGFTVAADAQAAMELIAEHNFTAVFTDIEGIQAGGCSAATVIVMCQARAIPVVCTSGNPVKAQALADQFSIDAIFKTEIEDHMLVLGKKAIA